jgi:hypothetical protein
MGGRHLPLRTPRECCKAKMIGFLMEYAEHALVSRWVVYLRLWIVAVSVRPDWQLATDGV